MIIVFYLSVLYVWCHFKFIISSSLEVVYLAANDAMEEFSIDFGVAV